MAKTVETYWELIEPYWEVINIYDGPEAFEASIRGAPRPVILLYSAHFCVSEVRNGGFLQFFMNSTGVLAPEAIEAFSAIGMPTLAALVNNAAETLGTAYPRNRGDRRDALLVASGHSQTELEEIFSKYGNESDASKGSYRAFVKATEKLPFESLQRQFWHAAKTENGGFEEAATRFANVPHLIQ